MIVCVQLYSFAKCTHFTLLAKCIHFISPHNGENNRKFSFTQIGVEVRV